MFRFIHAADIHLDSPLKGLESYEDAPVEEIRGATRRAFDNLIALALEEEVKFLLLAGDLYDGDWKDYHTGLFLVDRLARLKKANIAVVMISGNHDAASHLTKMLPLPENVTVLPTRKPGTVRLAELGVAIHGQGYATPAVKENLAAAFPPRVSHFFNIGLLHTSLGGYAAHDAYAPCPPAELLARGYDYWALGHVHQQEIVHQEPWIVYPGNLQGRHSRETGPKGAFLGTVAEGRLAALEFRELDVLRWARCPVDLSSCETGEAVFEEVRLHLERVRYGAEGRTVAVRLVLEGACPVHHQLQKRSGQWTEELRGLAAGLGEVWLEKVLFQTRRLTSLQEILDQDHPLSGLLQAVDGLMLDQRMLVKLVPELEALKNKLPPELREGSEPLLPATSSEWRDFRREVRELLLSTLLQQGEES